MKLEDVIRLVLKENAYEKKVFGEYKNVKCLNPASFLVMIQRYLNDMELSYQGPWSKKEKFPEWLLSCYESEHENGGPVELYENAIKLTALGIAILETYTEIDVEKWRENPEKDSQKWQNQNTEKEFFENE
jgi:hypothetical protein